MNICVPSTICENKYKSLKTSFQLSLHPDIIVDSYKTSRLTMGAETSDPLRVFDTSNDLTESIGELQEITPTENAAPLFAVPGDQDNFLLVREYLRNILTKTGWGIAIDHSPEIRAFLDGYIGTGWELRRRYLENDLDEICPTHIFEMEDGTLKSREIAPGIRKIIGNCIFREMQRFFEAEPSFESSSFRIYRSLNQLKPSFAHGRNFVIPPIRKATRPSIPREWMDTPLRARYEGKRYVKLLAIKFSSADKTPSRVVRHRTMKASTPRSNRSKSFMQRPFPKESRAMSPKSHTAPRSREPNQAQSIFDSLCVLPFEATVPGDAPSIEKDQTLMRSRRPTIIYSRENILSSAEMPNIPSGKNSLSLSRAATNIRRSVSMTFDKAPPDIRIVASPSRMENNASAENSALHDETLVVRKVNGHNTSREQAKIVERFKLGTGIKSEKNKSRRTKPKTEEKSIDEPDRALKIQRIVPYIPRPSKACPALGTSVLHQGTGNKMDASQDRKMVKTSQDAATSVPPPAKKKCRCKEFFRKIFKRQ